MYVSMFDKTIILCMYMQLLSLSIMSAASATTAAPTFFTPVQWEGGLFCDGALVANNPTAIALQEAKVGMYVCMYVYTKKTILCSSYVCMYVGPKEYFKLDIFHCIYIGLCVCMYVCMYSLCRKSPKMYVCIYMRFFYVTRRRLCTQEIKCMYVCM